MLPNHFNVWFVTKKVCDKDFEKIVSAYDLEHYFEDCWNYSQQAFIDSEMNQTKEVIEDLEGDKEDLEWDNKVLENDVSERDAVIASLLSEICDLKQKINDK